MKRRFEPEDTYRVKSASDPDLSSDGRRVAWVQGEYDEVRDAMATSIWVAPLDGSSAPRRFTNGPTDSTPRWSPDGHWLAFLSSLDEPGQARVYISSLDGGAPRRIGDLPGPASQLTWSPDSTRIAVVSRVGLRPKDAPAVLANAPREVRGLAPRFDGFGWYDGRRHIFVIDVTTGETKAVTSGEFDNVDPSFSPDGSLIAFSSDREPRRDDRQSRSDVWVVAAAGGKARRLSRGEGMVTFPAFSPDGSAVAYAGHVGGDSWDRDTHLFVVPLDGSTPPQRLAAKTDRGINTTAGNGSPFRWLSDNEIVCLVADRGSVNLHIVHRNRSTSREVLGGDRMIEGLAISPGTRRAVFNDIWPDRPSELWSMSLRGGEPTRISHLNDDLLAEVQIAPLRRTHIDRPDGTEVEYYTLYHGPKKPARRLPLHLEIHGGPHGMWPNVRYFSFHQSIAAQGYVVVLPNPRGSTSYGQEFTAACSNDWGGGDYEDILASCDDVIDAGIGDPDRMFVSGYSYGGFMTSWIVGHCHRFKAATASAPVIDMTSMALTTDIPDFSRFHTGANPWDDADEYRKRSPLTYLPDVRTPVLVVHWEGDMRVPIGQGEELYAGLRILGKKAAMVRYPGGFHIVRTPSQAVDWLKRLLAWNAAHDA